MSSHCFIEFIKLVVKKGQNDPFEHFSTFHNKFHKFNNTHAQFKMLYSIYHMTLKSF